MTSNVTSGDNSAAAATAGAPLKTPSSFTTTLVTVDVVFLALATIAVGLRVCSARISSSSKWLTRDLLILFASLLVTYSCIIATIVGAAIVGVNYVSDRLDPVKAGTIEFKLYVIDVITTTIASGLCKISILEFYKRIFITQKFHILCNIFVFLITAWMTGAFFTQLFSTTPISSAWHPELQGQDANYDYPTAILSIFGIGMTLDFLVLCLPLRAIYKLQLKMKSKIKVILILWLGIFCVICSSVRFYYSYKQLKVLVVATAHTKAIITINTAMWSKMEPSASIIAACLPTYGPLLNSSSLASVLKSARCFFSFSSRSNLHSKSALNKGNGYREQDVPGHNWLELRPNTEQNTNQTNIKSITNKTDLKDDHISTVSEFSVTRNSPV
ncbi:hypothetical protein ACMFMG_011738 [Clarireedia jacksonii]